MAKHKKIIAFGASDFLQVADMNYRELGLREHIICIADNDVRKQGGSFPLNGSRKDIVPPGRIFENGTGNKVVLIATDVYAYDIYLQLEKMAEGRNLDVFALPLMLLTHTDGRTDPGLLSEYAGAVGKIPRVIHYFWFSGREKTDIAKECIESWKRVCPGYELKEWNAENYDVEANQFAYEAYRQKKWAYVSDYARLDTVYRYGGIYLDLDVRLYRSLDALLHHRFFIGFGPLRDIEAAAFGAEQGCPLVGEMLDIYRNREFDPETAMRLPNLQPMLLSRFFEKKGFKINGKYQEEDGLAVYSRDVFSARNWFTGVHEPSETSVGIHLCAGGWTDSTGRSAVEIKKEGTMKLMEIYRSQASMGK